MSESTWQLQILGTFELLRDGEVVDAFGSRRDEEILAYMAVSSPTLASRDEIARALWPEVESETARKHVSYNLYLLKKRVAGLGMDNFVDEVRKRLRLNPEIRLDASEFVGALAAAAATSSATERVAQLQRAISMYGAGLLPGCSFDWLDEHQARFAELYRDAVTLLAQTTSADEPVKGLLQHLPGTAWQRQAPAQPGPSVAAEPAPLELPASLTTPDTEVDRQALIDLVAQAEVGLDVGSADREEWMDKVAAREREILAASQQAVEAGDLDDALRLVVPIWRFWHLRKRPAIGLRHIERILKADYSPPTDLRAAALAAAGTLAYQAGRRHDSKVYLEQAVEAWQDEDNGPELMRALCNLAITDMGLAEHEAAGTHFAQSLALATALQHEVAERHILLQAALNDLRRGDHELAGTRLERRLEMLGDEERDSAARAATIGRLAAVEVMAGNLDAATEWAEETYRIYQVLNDPRGLSYAASMRGHIAYLEGALDKAEALMDEAVSAARTSRSAWDLGAALGYQAVVLEAQQQPERAAEVMLEAVTILRIKGDEAEIQHFQQALKALQLRRTAQTTVLLSR